VVQGVFRGGDDFGVVGEAEIVVGAEVEDVAVGPPCYDDVGLLGGGEDALGFVEALVAELLELGGEVGLEFGVGAHGVWSPQDKDAGDHAH
jgi:hypothetical protein